MKRIWEKLHNRSGASMLFAILVFMLCILAATGAMSAAAANAGRYTHLEAEQQAYLSVASAIRLLKDEIADAPGNKFEVEVTATHTVVKDSAGTVTGDTMGYDVDPPLTSVSGSLQEAFCQFYGEKYLDIVKGSSDPVSQPFSTLTIDGIDGMGEVKVENVAINEDTFDITMTVKLATYEVKLTFPATMTDETVSVTTETTEDLTAGTTTETTITIRRGTVQWNEENVVITGMGVTP